MTIKDIARLSGCSVSTISRVINNRPDVNPETKEKVTRIMREVGFVPNTNAQQLKIQQSRNVVFVVKSTQNMFFADLLVRLQTCISEYGYNGIVNYLDENASELDSAERILRELKPKGIVFLGGNVDSFCHSFQAVGVPAVLATVTSERLRFENLSMVGVDDARESYRAVEYLIRRGHRKIAILGGPATSYTSKMRREGAIRCMADHGITFEPALYSVSNYDFASAYNAMNALLAQGRSFTAVFAMSDTIAFGALRALVSAGRRVPEDVSVIGFDGIAMASYCIPVLTTVRQPAERIARKSIELLVSQIEHCTPGRTVVVEGEIVEGESVRTLD